MDPREMAELMKMPPAAHRGPDGTGSYFDAYSPEQMCAYALAHKLYERDKWAKVLGESCADERSQLWEAGPGGGCSRAIEAESDLAKLREALRNIVAAADMHPVHLEQAIGRARRLLGA